MDKRKLIATVAKKSGYAAWEITKIIDPVMESILEALQAGEDVSINNFGKFKLKHNKPRRVVHPRTKQSHIVPARATVEFKATRMFKVSDDVLVQLTENTMQKNK